MTIFLNEYSKEHKEVWNKFIVNSKNGHFMFNRDYMDYHHDVYKDNSLIAYNLKGKIVSILPANIQDGILYSHQGLTFGGFITNTKMNMLTMLELFQCLKDYCKKASIHKIVYKCSPHVYHSYPSEEDLYALNEHDFRLCRRYISSSINLSERIPYQTRRRRAIHTAQKNNLIFERSYDFNSFWKILETILSEKYNTKPTHSIEEIKKLAILFPNNIKLYIARNAKEMLGGSVIYENKNISHTQYLANSASGKKVGALDFVIDQLITKVYNTKEYFDFGISNDRNSILNEGLIEQKEGFGARGITIDCYECEL